MPPAPRIRDGGATPLPSEPWQLEQFPANSCAPSSFGFSELSFSGLTIPFGGSATAGAASTRIASTASIALLAIQVLRDRARLRGREVQHRHVGARLGSGRVQQPADRVVERPRKP